MQLRFFRKLILISLLSVLTMSTNAEDLRIFTWDGYVTEADIKAVNAVLKDSGYPDIKAKVISPFAEGPEQMFKVIRKGSADITFLTLNYIKMQDNKIAKLLQPINTNSPRLSNYSKLSERLTQIPMGMMNGKPLYIPWGGGAYGIWANMNKLKESDLPTSVADLWQAKWRGQLGLSSGQIQPNIAIASMAIGKSPFYLNDMAKSGQSLGNEFKSGSSLLKKVTGLYQQVGQFWTTGPDFNDPKITLLASYGIAASAANKAGANWKIINFKEGNSVWLDTLNFHKDVKGRKLEAAEIFANYYIDKKIQSWLVNDLGMVAASSLVDSNPLIDENPEFFDVKMFWPPYQRSADNIMLKISNAAMKK